MDTLNSKGMAVNELADYFSDIGILNDANVEELDDQDVRERYATLARAIRLMLVAGRLDRATLAQAMELSEALD